MLFSTLKKNTIEKVPLHLMVNRRWFLQIVDRDSGNLYLKNKFFQNSCFLHVSCYLQHLENNKNWCKKIIPGGGGGGFRRIILSHFPFDAIVNIKKNTIERCPFT